MRAAPGSVVEIVLLVLVTDALAAVLLLAATMPR